MAPAALQKLPPGARRRGFSRGDSPDSRAMARFLRKGVLFSKPGTRNSGFGLGIRGTIMSRCLSTTAWLLAFTLAAGPAVLAQTSPAFTVDEMLKLKRVSDPQLSPDGSKIAFVVTDVNQDQNTRNNDIWVVPVADAPRSGSRAPSGRRRGRAGRRRQAVGVCLEPRGRTAGLGDPGGGR